jgi:hypothetical protein
MVGLFGIRSLVWRSLWAFFPALKGHNFLKKDALQIINACSAPGIRSHDVRQLSEPFGYRLSVEPQL